LGAGGLPAPGLVHLVQRERLHYHVDLTGLREREQLQVQITQLRGRPGEVREAEHFELLAANGGGRQRRLRSGRLADVDEPCVGSGGLRGRDGGSVPEKVEHRRRTLTAA